MTSETSLAAETAARIMRDLSTRQVINAAEVGQWPADLWAALEEAGIPLAWVPEALGGSEASLREGFEILRLAGRFAVPAPLAETLLAGLLLARAGLASPAGPMTVAPVHPRDEIVLGSDGRLSGQARGAPYARHAHHVALAARTASGVSRTVLVAMPDCRLSHGTNLAGEPADAIDFAGVKPVAVGPAGATDAATLRSLGAAARALQMAGGLERLLEQTLEYAGERVQFGRPIAGFQAIQHSLAQFAGEAAAASAAADAAAEALSSGHAALKDAPFDEDVVVEIAAAKIRVGEAASVGAAIAHQVHGAIGFTLEYSLQLTSRRLWSWRDDFGGESAWSLLLGRIAATQGADGLWPFVTGHARGSAA